MKATILKRYDINGSFTGDVDIKVGEFTPPENSMYRVYKVIDIDIGEKQRGVIVECHKCKHLNHYGSYKEGQMFPHCRKCLTHM